MQMEEHRSIRHKIGYKVIYLEEQVKLLDINKEATEALIGVLKKCK